MSFDKNEVRQDGAAKQVLFYEPAAAFVARNKGTRLILD
jgi:hypothetical protein